MSNRTPPRALLPALVMLTTVTSVVSSLGAPLVPVIARDADVSVAAAQWSLTATMLVGAVSTPLLGRLGTSRRRTVVLGGLIVVTVGLLACALPLGFGWLIVGRAMQGIGIALIPLAIAIACDCLPTRRVAAAISLLSVSTVAGSGLGYPLTALVAEHAGLSAAFWLGSALCCATLALSALTVPASPAGRSVPVDLWGALLLAAGTAGLLIALNRGHPWGWLSWPTVVAALASTAVLLHWGWRTLRISHPLVDLRLAFGPGALGANLTAVVAGVAVYLLISLTVLAVQAPPGDGFGLGHGVVAAGLLLVPYSLLTLTGSRLALLLGRRLGPDLVLPIGCLLYGAATVVIALCHESLWHLFLGMALAGLGGGTTFAVMPALLLRDLPYRETGSSLAFNMVLRFLGFAAGSALTPAMVQLFANNGAPTGATFTEVAAIGVGLWVGALLCATATARPVFRSARHTSLIAVAENRPAASRVPQTHADCT